MQQRTISQRNNRLLMWLIAAYLIWEMPIGSYYFNTYVAMGMLLLILLLVFITDLPRWNRTLPLFLPLMLLVVLQFVIDAYVKSGGVLNTLWSHFLKLIPLFAAFYLQRDPESKWLEQTTRLILLTQTITMITTYVGLLNYPNASRDMAAYETAYRTYYPLNIGGFSFIYTLTLLHPMVICLAKYRKIPFAVAILFSVFSGLCVFESAYTTAALIFLLSCIAYFFPRRATSRNWVRSLAVIGIFVLILVTILPVLLEQIATWDILSASSDKLTDLANLLQGREASSGGDVAGRMRHYQMSWDVFCNNIVFGATLIGSNASGGHSYILDLMANWGLLGLGCLAWCYGGIYITFYHPYRQTRAYSYAMLTLVLSAVQSILNPNIWLTSIGLFTPLIVSFAESDARLIPVSRFAQRWKRRKADAEQPLGSPSQAEVSR